MKSPPEGCIAVYMHKLTVGLRFPLHPLIPEILTPNSWPQILSFIATCTLKGMPTTLNTFKMCHAIQRNNSRSKSRGWWCLYNKSGVLTALDRPSAHHDWKNKFIFVHIEGEWGLPVWNDAPVVNNDFRVPTDAEVAIVKYFS